MDISPLLQNKQQENPNFEKSKKKYLFNINFVIKSLWFEYSVLLAQQTAILVVVAIENGRNVEFWCVLVSVGVLLTSVLFTLLLTHVINVIYTAVLLSVIYFSLKCLDRTLVEGPWTLFGSILNDFRATSPNAGSVGMKRPQIMRG